MGRARAQAPEHAEVDVFRAIADPTRRAILDRLREGSAPVNDLALGFRMTRPAISKHLRILRGAELVRERKRGRQRIYELEPTPLRDVSAWLASYRELWQHNLDNLKQYVESHLDDEADQEGDPP
jgi:DNA-binding transcriptional ArsR family regulator